MIRLSVNVNKVALLRNSRSGNIPSVAHAAGIALAAGAHGITVHPRPDGRHIRAEDVYQLRELVARHAGAEYNIEGNPYHQVMNFVRVVRPTQCTLVPDGPGALTSDHGWDLSMHAKQLQPVVAELRSLGVRVSLFMDPIPEDMAAVRALGADRVELYTEPYARAFGTAAEGEQLERYAAATRAASQVGLGVNAGHDLNRANLRAFARGVPGLLEVSIGHALVADAIEFGMARTVQLYLEALGGVHG
jgi:pyridoxine 5-phosphate synthase